MKGVIEPPNCFNCTDVNSSLARMQLIHTVTLSLTLLSAQQNATIQSRAIKSSRRREGIPSLLLESARGAP